MIKEITKLLQFWVSIIEVSQFYQSTRIMNTKCKTIAKKSLKKDFQNPQKSLQKMPLDHFDQEMDQFMGGTNATEMNDHEDQLEMAGITLGQTEQVQDQGRLPEKQKRKSNPQVSSLSKHHASGIINQMISAFKKLKDNSLNPHFQQLYDILCQKFMLAKTKFVFLCILISRVKCFQVIGKKLDQILKQKADKIEVKYRNNHKTLQLGRQSMNLYKDIRTQIRATSNFSLSMSIQDIKNIMQVLYKLDDQKCPRRSLQGLHHIHSSKIKEYERIKLSLETFGINVDDDHHRSRLENLGFIQPNINNIPLDKLSIFDVQDFMESFSYGLDEDYS